MSDLSGGYTVIVERDFSGEALRWEGYAENPSDALHQALDLREEAVAELRDLYAQSGGFGEATVKEMAAHIRGAIEV